MRKWTVEDSDDLYLVSRWGAPYFSINDKGHLVATPNSKPESAIDLSDLVEDLYSRGISLPVLVRFQEILGHRIASVAGAFERAIKEYEYTGSYRPVVPIKVNQQMHVVQELIQQGKAQHLGLEAGSKPELLAAIGMIDDPESTIICNGYKDFEYLETALLSCKLGLKTIIICDRFQELEALVQLKNERGLTGPIGIRTKLASRGAGRWAESGGEGSKFGLTVRELVQAIELLRDNDMLESLTCMHFHIGSQITAIRAVTAAV
ncbi:MAG: arginine decarboxylase, partial [Planctomycetes bacterium]|nr:arginine decarboxylase [Planctomycetota bacterium]